MGWSFAALMRCPVFTGMDDPRIESIEAGSPPAVRNIRRLMLSCGFAVIEPSYEGWVTFENFPEPIARPWSLTLDAAFETHEDFFLTFGDDSVEIFHPLSWDTVLTDKKWERAMLEACRALAEVFEATEGIVTRNESPAIIAVGEIGLYDEALEHAQGEEGEREHLRELYEIIEDDGTWDSHGYWCFLKPGSQ